MEMLIAVGALAFVAVGIAAIFEATGRTVRAGRRVSDFSAYANLVEQQLKADLALMTRDGFLLIRNENCDADGDGQTDILAAGQANPDDVPLSDADTHPRLRRTDELMFFAKGSFTSLREPLDPRFVAEADAAAIYYGHGERRVNYDANPNANLVTSYRQPQLDDNVAQNDQYHGIDRNARLGFASTSAVNPNRYAANWILVRHVTLLRPPQTSRIIGGSSPGVFNLPPGNLRLQDSDVQAGLQPAASSIFRSLAAVFPLASAAPPRIRTEVLTPQMPSGLVDIATTDLSEIRMIVTTADVLPGAAVGANFFVPGSNAGVNGTNAGVDGVYRAAVNDRARMQAWMEDALPSWSNPTNPLNRTRMRCEPAPTDYVGLADPTSPTYVAENSNSGLDRAFRRADQTMLSSSNFLPHCTEFIVEWSFGNVYPSNPVAPGYNPLKKGQIIWHGMPREANGQLVCDFYNDDPGSLSHVEVPYVRVNGTQGTHIVPSGLIHGGFNATRPGDPLSSYFGYTDPTFDPEEVGNHNGLLDLPNESRYPTIPWAWPKLIRVTISLADPNDPTVEQSFQFVFDVPQTPQ